MHLPSLYPKRTTMPRGPRVSTREKVDDVLKYIRDKYDWSAAQFIAHFITAFSTQLHAHPPDVRRKRFIKQVQDEGLDWIATLQEAGISLDASWEMGRIYVIRWRRHGTGRGGHVLLTVICEMQGKVLATPHF